MRNDDVQYNAGGTIARVHALNGWIEVGDEIAVAYRSGNTAEMRTGIVVEFREFNRYGTPYVRVKYRCAEDSCGPNKPDAVMATEMHSRIVKLGPFNVNIQAEAAELVGVQPSQTYGNNDMSFTDPSL